MELQELITFVRQTAVRIHQALGPGLFASAYEACLRYELEQAEISFCHQKEIPLHYQDLRTDLVYRADFVLQDQLIVECVAVEEIENLHNQHLHTLLQLSDATVAMRINFNVLNMATAFYVKEKEVSQL